MKHTDIAREFVQRFCDGNLDGLEPLLDEKLHARGPLHEFHDRAGYLGQLRARPPGRAEGRIISVTENDEQVCVIYEYSGAVSMTLVQLFTIREGRIVDMLVIFDTGMLRKAMQ